MTRFDLAKGSHQMVMNLNVQCVRLAVDFNERFLMCYVYDQSPRIRIFMEDSC